MWQCVSDICDSPVVACSPLSSLPISSSHLCISTSPPGNGHDLVLTARPVLTTGVQLATDFYTSTGSFDNNYAINSRVQGMPTRDITVEFWASLPKVRE